MKFHFWFTFLSLFYIALVAIGVAWLQTVGKLPAWIPLSDFLLMTLATMRLVRLFTYDNITAFVRAWFLGAPEDTFLGALGVLINCPWCTGLWFAFVVVFAYFATPYAWYVILILALSALASSLQVLMNLIGWSAEAKKKEAESVMLPR